MKNVYHSSLLTHLAVASLLSTVAVFTGGVVLQPTSASAAALTSKLEGKCVSKVSKAATKAASTTAKSLAKCRDADISGKAVGSCPDAKGQAKIDKAKAKATATAAKSCGSTCTVSEIDCVADNLCPPLAGAANELCKGDGAFDMATINYPGPFCESTLGEALLNGSQLGECAGQLGSASGSDLVDLVYGSIGNADGLSKETGKCLSTISKSAVKLASTVAKGVAKCRDSINNGKTLGNPRTCTTDDAKLAGKISKADAKLRADIAKKCTASDILELDLCGEGVGGVTSIADAQDCVAAAAAELGDSQELAPDRSYSTRSIVEAAYPPTAVCGDNVINQGPSSSMLLGEECDGVDDSSCPGLCFPPGDLFQCTCGNVSRYRIQADAIASDSDAGWIGGSHDQATPNKGGFVLDRTGCDCSELTNNTCTGSSADPLCTVTATTRPTCSNTPGVGDCLRDEDCRTCDSFNSDAGASCTDHDDCQAQCYDSGGSPVSNCSSQADCGANEICRGQCDRSADCVFLLSSSPFPVSNGGTPVCTLQKMATDVTGTQDMQTGASQYFYEANSKVYLGINTATPCPVCGGFCDGGTFEGLPCSGSCSTSGDECRFSSDCPGGETCTIASADCPGSSCNLSDICFGGAGYANNGIACEVGDVDPVFGSVSNDCPPDEGKTISGEFGLRIRHLPKTSHSLSLDAAVDGVPCSSAGYELYDCPCPDAGGVPTQVNSCNPGCNAGINSGGGCADATSSGFFASCAGGANAGRACDEDSDCPGSSCVNPSHCEGDPATEHAACTSSATCGTGSCVDACPGGLCVPLCELKTGDPWPQDRECSTGPTETSCTGEGHAFRVCDKSSIGAGCNATCVTAGTPCTSQADCEVGDSCEGPCEERRQCEAGLDGFLGNDDDFIGAADCIETNLECFAPLIEGTGLISGNADNYQSISIYCYTATTSPAINSGAGFGGPARNHEIGINISNGVLP
ncbi:MAG: hypothetical protein H8E45_07665 [Proteobacteria bacterium]|nr:hypothetical protein [Pseudomonadota bacterium]